MPPGVGLNVTFATINQDICLAVGAAPEAVQEPYRLTRLMLEGLERLAAEISGKSGGSAPASRKSGTRKSGTRKSGTRKAAANKATGRKTTAPRKKSKTGRTT